MKPRMLLEREQKESRDRHDRPLVTRKTFQTLAIANEWVSYLTYGREDDYYFEDLQA